MSDHQPPTCRHCGSVLSVTTWTCVRGVHCPGNKPGNRIANARKVARDAFDALWKPGPQQRTQSRDKAMFWLMLARRAPGQVIDFDKLDIEACREVSRLCRRAHGPTIVSLTT